jgi:hypothetical protein
MFIPIPNNFQVIIVFYEMFLRRPCIGIGEVFPNFLNCSCRGCNTGYSYVILCKSNIPFFPLYLSDIFPEIFK